MRTFSSPHLYTEDVGSSLDQLIGQLQVILQRVLLPHRVRDVARVGDGGLHHAAGSPGSLHAQQHVGQVVEGVKYAEDVHPILLGHLAEPGGERTR